MAENQLSSTVESLFRNMDGFLSSKTCVGEPIRVQDTLLIPFVDISFGCGAGAGAKKSEKQNAMGGITGKMTPTAVMVIKDGSSRVVSLKDNDTLTRILDMAPDLINRFTHRAPDVSIDKEAVRDAVSQQEGNK